VITGWREEYLSLVLQAPESLGMYDAVPITLKSGANRIFRLDPKTPAALHAKCGRGR
tara:strand:- start:148 stop:318 length:171 start_codon:yes stop_codon:yes gene_type:complete